MLMNTFTFGLLAWLIVTTFIPASSVSEGCNIEFFCIHLNVFWVLRICWVFYFVATLRALNLGPDTTAFLAETQTYNLCQPANGNTASPQVMPMPIEQQQPILMGQAQQQQPMPIVMGQAQPHLVVGQALPQQPIVMGQAQPQQPIVVGQAQPQQPIVLGQAIDPLQKIAQLKGLLDAGAITQAEFDTKKAEQLSLM